MSIQHITFLSDGLALEGVLFLPEHVSRVPGIVICHPHPLHGGDMDNNVVTALANALAGAGYAAFFPAPTISSWDMNTLSASVL